MPDKYIYALDLSLNSSGVCIFSNDGKIVDIFTIDTNREKEVPKKLKIIGDTFIKISKIYLPDILVIEQGFSRFNTGTQALFKVHGLVNYLFSDYKQIYYPPASIKKTVTGKGNATKEDVKNSLLEIYPGVTFKNNDESDACATGVAYFIKEGVINNAEKNI